MIIDHLPLYSLYQLQTQKFQDFSCLEKVSYAFFMHGEIDIESLIESRDVWQAPLSEEKMAENWKALLHLTLLGALSQSSRELLSQKVHASLYQPWNQHSQYLRLIVALNQFLVGQPSLETGPYLLESGAAPIELHEYCPWQSLPYFPYHAEFGFLLCLLGHLTKRADLLAKAIQLAKWQLNSLGGDFFPLHGLFAQEKDGAAQSHLLWNYLLFHAIALFTEEKTFEMAAQTQLQHLKKSSVQKPIPSIFVLFERLMHQEPVPLNTELEFSLPEQICDLSTSLAGHRLADSHAVCTLHGGHTGLGCYRLNDIHIVNYGPQYLPLGECEGFGIEGNYLSDRGVRRSVICCDHRGFNLKGCVRLVDQPDAASAFGLGQFRGIWLETEQEYRQEKLNISTQFLGFDGWDSVAFTFFIKAQRCRINGSTIIQPRTLERYEGPVRPISIEGAAQSLSISSMGKVSQMQIIPLSGGDSFWGADFLVAYSLNPDERQYRWTIAP